MALATLNLNNKIKFKKLGKFDKIKLIYYNNRSGNPKK